MKKANFSLVLSSLIFLLFIGVQSVSAQNSLANSDVLEGKAFDVSDVDFVDIDDAMAILNSSIKNLGISLPGLNTTMEANTTARMAYYDYLAVEIEATGNVEEVIPNSVPALYQIVGRYQQDLGIDAEAIYTEVVALLDL
jgi:hypothetical protein